MRVSVTVSLLVLALFGAAIADTVFVANADVRASINTTSSSVSRNWIGVPSGQVVTYYGYQGTNNGQTAQGSVAIVISNGATYNSLLGTYTPYIVNWAYIQASANKGGSSYDFSASAVASSFNVFGYVVYTDANGNGVYDQGEETSFYRFGATNAATVDSAAASNGKPANYLVSHTATDSNSVLRYILANQDITSQGVFNRAENAKIDFWFQPQYNPNEGPNSRVALITAFAAVQASVSGGGSVSPGSSGNSGQGSLTWSASGVTTQLTWTPTASALNANNTKSTVNLKSQVLVLDQSQGFTFQSGIYINGVKQSTAVTVGQDTSGKFAKANLLLFSFDAQRPSELYWDPSVGQSNNAFTKAASLLVVLSAIAVALF